MKTLHFSIIVILFCFILLCLKPIQAYAANDVEIQNIQTLPPAITVGQTFKINATLINNSSNQIFVGHGACEAPFSVTFDTHVLVSTNNINCTLQMIEQKLNPGEKIIATSPYLDLVYKATDAGTTNATVTFSYNTWDPTNQSNIEKTISKSFLFTIYGNNTGIKAVNEVPLSPLEQFKSGTPLQKIQCMTDLILVIKAHEGTPACVRQSSIAKLVYRGWASLISTQPEPTLRIIGPYDGLLNPTGIVTIQNKTFFMTTFNGTLNPYSGYQEIAFHGINFTLFPQPQSLEISGKEFYADVGFSENVHEQLWLDAPIYADMGNITITKLTQHANPQAGIVSYNEQIKLLVSTDVNTTGTQTQTSDSSSALKLYLSTSFQVIQSGQPIGITITVNNTLPTQLYVRAENSGALPSLSLEPCIPRPFGIAMFQGYYSKENMTDGNPLLLFNPDASCPVMNATQSYVFEPSSAHVVAYTCTDTGQPLCSYNDEMADHVSINGYWYQGQVHPFQSGIYTIIGGDDWGHVSIEHFVVLP